VTRGEGRAPRRQGRLDAAPRPKSHAHRRSDLRRVETGCRLALRWRARRRSLPARPGGGRASL